MQLDGDFSVENSALQMISFFSNEGEDDHVKKDLILGASNDDTLPYYQPKQPVEMQVIKRTAALPNPQRKGSTERGKQPPLTGLTQGHQMYFSSTLGPKPMHERLDT